MLTNYILSNILSKMRYAVIICDDNCKLVFRNAYAENLIGIPDEPGMAVTKWTENYKIYHGDEVTPYDLNELPLITAVRTGKETFGTNIYIVKNGEKTGTHLNVDAFILQDEKDITVGGVAIIRDISDRIRMKNLIEDFQVRLNNLKGMIEQSLTQQWTSEKLIS